MRSKKAINNVIWGLFNEIISLICSFILPRLILTSFGSDYNGMTNAISQFLSVSALFQAGIGGVTVAALYKPLSENNIEQISIIYRTTEKFLRKIAFIYIIFALFISVVYPYFIFDDFEWFFTFSLTLIMSLSAFAQYFFGNAALFVFRANQRQDIIYIVNMLKIAANTAVAVFLINSGFGIREVKLGSAVVFIAAPIILNIYVKKKYKIISSVKTDYSHLSQRWAGFAHEIANFITTNTDLIVLSIFSNIYEVSVYTIYNLILGGLMIIIFRIVAGIDSAFGDMFARNQQGISENFRIFEQVVFAVSTFVFGVAMVTIVPFIKVYTQNVTDANYMRYAFAYIFTIATVFKCISYPYSGITKAVGHFKQTKNIAIIEAVINIFLSIVLVISFGMVGIVIGTLVSCVFKTVAFAFYMSGTIIKRSVLIFFKRLFFMLAAITATFIFSSTVHFGEAFGYFDWAVNAMVISIFQFAVVLLIEVIFYMGDLKRLVSIIKYAVKK